MSYQPTSNVDPAKYGDGTGRNSYITHADGRKAAPSFFKPMIPISAPPVSTVKSHFYVNDGSGRDMYVSKTTAAEFKPYDYYQSLRSPIVHGQKNLRPLSAFTYVEHKKYLEQQSSCRRLAQPKTVTRAINGRTQNLHQQDADRDLYGAPIRTRAFSARIRSVGNQRNPNDGFKSPSYSTSKQWL